LRILFRETIRIKRSKNLELIADYHSHRLNERYYSQLKRGREINPRPLFLSLSEQNELLYNSETVILSRSVAKNSQKTEEIGTGKLRWICERLYPAVCEFVIELGNSPKPFFCPRVGSA